MSTGPALPQVWACLASSLDGRIAETGHGAPQFTSRYDLEKLFSLRARVDALLIGGNTVRSEKLPPLVRNKNRVEERKSQGLPDHPLAVVVSQSLNLPWSSSYFSGENGQKVGVMSSISEQDAPAAMKKLGVAIVDGGNPFSLRTGLANLYKMGCRQVLAEGGGGLIHSLLDDGLIDRFYLTIAPTFIGGKETPLLCRGDLLKPRPLFEIAACEQVHGELHIEYHATRDCSK